MKLQRLLLRLLLGVVLSAPVPVHGREWDCGQPQSTGDAPTTADSLATLRAAVGLASRCDFLPCTCDPRGDGKVTATDALVLLRASVGIEVQLECACRLQPVFFGVNNDCDSTSVDYSLIVADEGSRVLLDDLGQMKCILDSALEGAGCKVRTEMNRWNMHFVTRECTIPADPLLFACLFEKPDIARIRNNSLAWTHCGSPAGDEDNRECAGFEPVFADCEVCTNGKDDDGDGLVDCEDSDCFDHGLCFVASTSTSTTTTIPTAGENR